MIMLHESSLDDGINDGINDGLILTDTDRQILNEIASNPQKTITALANILKKSESTIERRIKILRQQGMLSRQGSKKSGHGLFWIKKDECITNQTRLY